MAPALPATLTTPETRAPRSGGVCCTRDSDPTLASSSCWLRCTAYLSITQPAFPTYANAINILQTSAVGLIVGVGLTLVLLCGGFDISVGGMVSLAGVGMALLITNAHVPPLIAILIVVIGGGVIGGGLNGFLIAKVGLQFLVVDDRDDGIFARRRIGDHGGASEGLYNSQFMLTWARARWGDPRVVFIAAVCRARFCGYPIHRVWPHDLRSGRQRRGGEALRESTWSVSAASTSDLLSSAPPCRQPSPAYFRQRSFPSAEPTAARKWDPADGGGARGAARRDELRGRESGVWSGTVLGTLFLGVIANGLTNGGRVLVLPGGS